MTRAGLVAERVTQAFWPFWTVLFFVTAPLMMGWQDQIALELVWVFAMAAVFVLTWTFVSGLRRIEWPTHAEAAMRVDSRLPGRPIAALNDVQAIGAGRCGVRGRLVRPSGADGGQDQRGAGGRAGPACLVG